MSTRNAFAAFGLANDVATVEAWRSDMARIVRAYFTRSRLSQTAFAKKLGIKQSVVSRIINSRLHGLSLEFLLRLCVKLETRGYAAWGPSPDEAFATAEPLAAGATATVILTPNYAENWLHLEGKVGSTNRTPSKSATSRPH